MTRAPDASHQAVMRAGSVRRLYLDTSFFIELEREYSAHSRAAKQLSDLTQVIPLCLSFMTVVELAKGKPSCELQQMARFIDSLNPCWLRSECELERQEILSYLKSPDEGPFGAAEPFDGCMYGIFKEEIRWYEGPDLLSSRMTFEDILSCFQKSERGRFLMNSLCKKGGYYLSKLREDRQTIPHTSAHMSQGRLISRDKAIDYLQTRIGQEYIALLKEGNATISVPKSGTLFIPDTSLLSPISEEDIVKFPAFFMSREFLDHRASIYRNMKDESFSSQCAGEAGDYFHLSGAAYCDFFSCDGRTRNAIEKARKSCGLRKPFVMDKKGASGLLLQIEQAL
jgi:hypothetical protein